MTTCPDCGAGVDVWRSTHPHKYRTRLVCKADCGWQQAVKDSELTK